MGQPWLGLYVIVRDAEKTIGTLLKSIRGVFDEVVIVDTGSKDRTREIVGEHFGNVWEGPETRVTAPRGMTTRLVFASFDWIDDFSAARQFSFELGTAKWRMYLDADDDATDLQGKLRRMLERTEKEHPEVDCVSLKYDYVPDEMSQDKIRLVRWADGWKFEDPVHEHLVPTGHAKHISIYTDVWVRHVPDAPGHHAAKSFDRNVRIAEKAYQDPAVTPEKKALWAYYLANYAHELGDWDLARRYYREVGDGLGRNNITCEGLCRWARMEMKLGHIEQAIDLAAEAIGKAPELPDGLATLGVALTRAGEVYRAAGVFDLLRAIPKPAMETQHDAVWLDGIAWAHAATAYYRAGRINDAIQALNGIPAPLMTHPEVQAAGRGVYVSLQKTDGFERLRALWEFLIWDTEPLKARKLLQECCPAAFSDSPQLQALLRQTEAKMPHMKDWAAYQRTYAAIPDLPYHVPEKDRAWTLLQARARLLRQWAESLPKEGSRLAVLAIGIQDGIIEGAMMEANPRLVLTCCDVAPQASRGIAELVERFPGRVEVHKIREGHIDWIPAGTTFDAVILFEVLEHLPDSPGDRRAISTIWWGLNPGGRLFLSTPVASQWVEPYLSDLKSDRPWWHVRAHNPTSLWNLLRDTGFTGSLVGVQGEYLFLAALTKVEAPLTDQMEFSIYVYPQRPMTEGFDPFSPKLGHVGGSEEAVIHLSAALARKGHRVSVYTDMPERKDKVFVHQGVQWRTHDELDVPSLEGSLLVWRAPQAAAQFKKQNPRLRVLNWLHDTHYTQRAP